MKERKLIFIGGIHGVGKGTLCKTLSSRLVIPHYSSSELLKWEEISSKENKAVKDFDETQNRLLGGIENKVEKNKLSLLDGHFCLLNKEGVPEKINVETFKLIDPIAVCIKIQDVTTIHKRLEMRDGNKYDYEILNSMQKLEISQAKKVSKILKIPYFEIYQNDSKDLENFIKTNK